jgi:cytochrome c peroxidase
MHRIGFVVLVGVLHAGDAAAQWSEADRRTIASLRLNQLPAVPPDPSNRVADDANAAALGKELFFDERFSKPGNVSCATCHQPAFQFQDGRPRGKAIGITPRRTQPLANVSHAPWLFWDGRKDSAWSQALAPLEDPAEHGGTRVLYVRLVSLHYRTEYEAVFGALPSLVDLPEHAGPLGTPGERIAWRSIAKERQRALNRAFANIGKAIAAYERTIVHAASRFDRFANALVRGVTPTDETDRLNEDEQAGLALFIGKAQCINCHSGPLFTDQYFHSTRVPPLDAARPDLGRFLGSDSVLADEFNCLGPHSDAKAEACRELKHIVHADPLQKRAFKTPSLRGVATRPPYMHAGQFATLEAVIAHYIAAPEADPTFKPGQHQHNLGSELLPLMLTAREAGQLVAFLKTLDGAVVEKPTGVRRP